MENKADKAWIDALTGDELLRVLDALSSPHRLRIVAALQERRVHVSQLAREVGISRPLVHMHLRKLEEAGLVEGELELSGSGRAMRYFAVVPFLLRLTPASLAEAAKTITAAKAEKEKN